jgi:RNA polymerase sigma-70 factor, ECF subfamily
LRRREQTIERYIVDLRRYACALLGSAAEADELVQDCLLRALARQHFWTRIRDMRAYLFAILHNAYIDRLTMMRRRGTAVALDDDNGSEECSGLSQPPGQLLSLELGDVVRAIAALPFEQREVVLLVGLEGMSYQAVADILDVPVGTVMSRLSRGRAALHHMVEEGWDAASPRPTATPNTGPNIGRIRL